MGHQPKPETGFAETRSTPSIWLRLARWLVVVYAVAMFMALGTGLALFPRYAATRLNSDDLNAPNQEWTAAQTQAALTELHWPETTVVWVQAGSGLLIAPVAYLVLALLLWRGTTSWFRVYVAFVCAGFGGVGVVFDAVVDVLPALGVYRDIFGAIGWQFFFITFFFFPNGRPVLNWTRWLVGLWGGLIGLEVVLHLTSGKGLGDLPHPQSDAIAWLSTGLVLTAIGSLGYRYFWRSDIIQRQQIKWVVYTLLLVALVIGGVVLPFAFQTPNPARLGSDLILALIHLGLFRSVFALVFVAIGIAILRYRLFDIDVLIRRTLQYSVLSGLLALVYFGMIVILQGFFTAVSGQESAVATVLSTLAIAALFFPLRRRVQNFIDKRFYRQKYDAQKVLAGFAATARDETDLDTLTTRLVEVVQETMQPEQVTLWLKATKDDRRWTVDNATVRRPPSSVDLESEHP